MENTHLVDCLRKDHAQLCGELAELKKAEINDNPPSWQTLRDVCARLSTGLREHIRREESLFVTHHRSLGAAALEAIRRPLVDHYGDYRYLQVITRCISLESRPFLLNSRYQLLRGFLKGLHQHIEIQETELFPATEQLIEN